MKKDSPLYVLLFTIAICVVFVLPLSLANELTRSRVQANELFASRSALLNAFGIPYASPAEAEEAYTRNVREITDPDGAPAWSAAIDGKEYFAVKRSGPGLWGTITAIVAGDAAGERLRGVEMLAQVETPGLGGRIDEAWFKEQFRDKRIGPGGRIAVDQAGTGKGEPDKEKPRVDAISGASRTSDFISQIVDDSIVALKNLGGAR